MRRRHSLLFRFAIATVFVNFFSLPSSFSCTCSPFSGNPSGDCCDGKDNNTCGSWFHHDTCTKDRPVCCTSSFQSVCCEAGDVCSPGCRNSFKGKCECLQTSSLESVGFNMTDAVYLLGFSAASQCEPELVANWSCTACNQSMYKLYDINVTESGGHMAFTAWDNAEGSEDGTIRVTLRGSLSVRDWISDADFVGIPAYSELGCESCKVEKGFFDAFKDLQPGIEASVESLLKKHPKSSITVTGHSLGGAMSAHAAIALKLIKKWKLKTPVYTFGQPRVGDASFAKWFAGHFPGWLRSVHWNDPVPHLPPDGLFDYRHMPRELWWSKNGGDDAIVCNGSGEDRNCSDSIVAPLIFTDHWYYLGYRVCGCVPFIVDSKM